MRDAESKGIDRKISKKIRITSLDLIESPTLSISFSDNIPPNPIKIANFISGIVIPPNTMVKLDDTIFPYKQKEIKNDIGQEVIVMDSRWVRKIVNDNDILLGTPNTENMNGLWYLPLLTLLRVFVPKELPLIPDAV